MIPFDVLILLVLACVALIAGAIDTLAGGGGLINVPAIMMVGISPVVALGTIKLQAAVCEFTASWQFIKRQEIDWVLIKPCLLFTIIGALIGAMTIQFFSSKLVRITIPFIQLAMLIYYLSQSKWKFGKTNSLAAGEPAVPQDTQLNQLIPDTNKFLLLGLIIGFYNGFFGPGTGSLWIIALMKCFSLSIKKATMYAKPMNFIGNLTALVIFLIHGHVNLPIALAMSVGAFLGGRYGARWLINSQEKWLQVLFVLMLSSATGLFFYKAFFSV